MEKIQSSGQRQVGALSSHYLDASKETGVAGAHGLPGRAGNGNRTPALERLKPQLDGTGRPANAIIPGIFPA